MLEKILQSYKANTTRSNDTEITVSPDKLVFEKNERKTYTLTIRYRGNNKGYVPFGWFVWVEENGNQLVRSSIVVT